MVSGPYGHLLPPLPGTMRRICRVGLWAEKPGTFAIVIFLPLLSVTKIPGKIGLGCRQKQPLVAKTAFLGN